MSAGPGLLVSLWLLSPAENTVSSEILKEFKKMSLATEWTSFHPQSRNGSEYTLLPCGNKTRT